MGKETAIIVAGGSGRRMGMQTPKQYLPLCGKPVICRSIEAFECSEIIDEIILVAAPEYVSWCNENIIAEYRYSKVSCVIPGGAQRYDSVYEGLKAAAGSSYVYIHDAARPYLTQEMIRILSEAVHRDGAAAAAVPVKDTIKSADAEGFADGTLDRSHLRSIQTPQAFSYELIRGAYERMMCQPHADITDDTMVAERYGQARVRLVAGSSCNFKITTPEDLVLMEALFQRGFQL